MKRGVCSCSEVCVHTVPGLLRRKSHRASRGSNEDHCQEKYYLNEADRKFSGNIYNISFEIKV